MTKKRILKVSKNLKDNTDFKDVLINEDLTKLRSNVAFKARQLRNNGFVKQSWTVDGKVFPKEHNDKISVAHNEISLKTFIKKTCPRNYPQIFPDPVISGQQEPMDGMSYAVAASTSLNIDFITTTCVIIVILFTQT